MLSTRIIGSITSVFDENNLLQKKLNRTMKWNNESKFTFILSGS